MFCADQVQKRERKRKNLERVQISWDVHPDKNESERELPGVRGTQIRAKL